LNLTRKIKEIFRIPRGIPSGRDTIVLADLHVVVRNIEGFL
jgi:hypothetical protein